MAGLGYGCARSLKVTPGFRMPPRLSQHRPCLAVVLAAGEGTRMRSSLPKALHAVAGRSLIAHVLATARKAGCGAIAVVVGPDSEMVAAAVREAAPDAQVFVQRERLGTAHAVLAAREALAQGEADLLVMFADTPLVRAETLARLRGALDDGAAVAVLGFTAAEPQGYGRLIVKDGDLVAIREERDATNAERAIRLCNAGLMALSGAHALALLDKIDNRNAKGEFYLTDAIAVARDQGLTAVAIETGEDEVRGINTKAQLAQAEAVAQQQLRAAAMEAGVTLVAPETVFLCADTKLGRDVTVEPNVVFGPGVTVEEGAVIRAFSHLEGAHVGRGARVGPFARLRPGAELGADVHIGNFVEVKAARIGEGAKANHLAYIGDATVGEAANVGAGTITCNYDGVAKHRTEIGKGTFIGSNSALVAPVSIGDGAYVGSGSVITKNVPAGALAIARGEQMIKEGWAERLRDVKALGRKTPRKKA
jgi:bifunctional UDP-N-acetylglucosamine pyrophosphorylase/glucosamine-1-phosphate N-acetyltransferase